MTEWRDDWVLAFNTCKASNNHWKICWLYAFTKVVCLVSVKIVVLAVISVIAQWFTPRVAFVLLLCSILALQMLLLQRSEALQWFTNKMLTLEAWFDENSTHPSCRPEVRDSHFIHTWPSIYINNAFKAIPNDSNGQTLSIALSNCILCRFYA